MKLLVAMRQKARGNRDNSALRAAIYQANAVLDRIQPWLNNETTSSLRWFPGAGETAVLFRSNEPETSKVRAGWISNKNRAWGWSGVIDDELHERLAGGSPESQGLFEEVEKANGSFALIGATPSSITVSTNVHRSEVMYWGETPDIVIFSNSAAFINLMVNGGKPRYSELGIAGALVHALPVTSETVFSDVQIVDPGVTIKSSTKNEFEYVKQFETGKNLDLDIPDLADSISESLVEYARALSAGSGEIRAGITGGKDSRLVVAALAAAGKTFETYTSGLPEAGDVVIGQQVAKTLGMSHKILVPRTRRGASGGQVVVGNPELQAWRTLRSTGGLGNAFTAMPSPHVAHQSISKLANFGGQGGEIIRGGYLRDIPKELINRDTAREYFVKTWVNNGDILTPLAREGCVASLSDTFKLASLRPHEALFRAYIERRTGRWLGTMRHGESVSKSHTTLLINNRMVWEMLQVNPELLSDEYLAFCVMRNLNSELIDIPFFKDRWAFEKEGPSTMYAPESWASRAPYTADKQPRATFNWRVAYSKNLSSYFKDYIFSFEDSQLFDVVDKEKVLAMLNGRGYRAPLAWALFSTQYALSNSWLSPTEPTGAAEVEVPVP